MKVGRKQQGFTIVETLIVLAVSGALFLVAAVAVSGKQARQEFTQSIQDVRSQIQQVVNEVGTGYYPNMNNLSCMSNATGPKFSTSVTGQGENAGCITLGKVMQFDLAGSAGKDIRVYTVAGLQKSGQNDVTTLSEAKPKVVAPSDSDGSVPDISERRILLYGLTAYKMTDLNSGNNIGSFGILNSLAKYGDAGIISGSLQLKAYPIANSSLGNDAMTGAEIINDNLVTSAPAVDKGVTICFVSGGTEQSGLITIGGGNRQLSVTLQIKSNRTCA